MSDKLNINNEMRQFDLKNRGFYDELTEEERKKFSNYLMLRWGSSVNGDPDLARYYILSMNQQANKNFWELNKHPKLQWLLMTCVSPGMGSHKHEWIAFKGKAAKNKRAQLIAGLFPTMKMDEAELLSDMMTDQELEDHLKDLAWDDKKIKQALKGKSDGD
jgi:hypothetical protein